MCSYRKNQCLKVLNLYSVLINKILATEFITVKASQVHVFKSNQMFEIKHSETNQLQKTIECNTNELSIQKYNHERLVFAVSA